MEKLAKYLELKKQTESAKQRTHQIEGALSELMKQLNREFACTTLKEAQRKHRLLTGQTKRLKKDYEQALEEFEEKWKGNLH